MGIDDRIKTVRKSNGMTQTEFAESLGVSRNVIKTYELAIVNPSEIFINHLCLIYGINKHWLETGDGDMMADMSKEDKIAKFIGEALSDDNSFKNHLIRILSELDDDGWKKLDEAAHALLDAQEQCKAENS